MTNPQPNPAGLIQLISPPRNSPPAAGGSVTPSARAPTPCSRVPEACAVEAFRQTNDFYYACGVEVAHAYLLLDGGGGKAALDLPHRDRVHANEGDVLTADEPEVAKQLTGVDAVYGASSNSPCTSAGRRRSTRPTPPPKCDR